MTKPVKLSVIIGSLRKNSINRIFANYISQQLPDHVTVEEIVIHDLPLYNQDYDQQSIESYDRVRQQIQASDAILIVTPEHNRTLPAALKNVIDIASRPHGQSVWPAKKVAVVTAVPGTYGGRECGIDVRKVMQSLSAKVMITPEVYLSRATESIEEGQVTSDRTKEFVDAFAEALVKFIGG